MAPSSEGKSLKLDHRKGAGLHNDSKKVKLPRLPKSLCTLDCENRIDNLDTQITKRPLLHPSVPSSHTSASSQKVIYVSPSTPFISAVKRVRALLAEIEKRDTPTNVTEKRTKGEEVFLKGTGKAIEKVLNLGLFFQAQKDCWVRVGTRSVGTVDDVIAGESADEEDVGDTRVRRVSVVEVAVGLR